MEVKATLKRSTATTLALSSAPSLVLQAGLGSRIVLILCFIVLHMYSNLNTKYGLIWRLNPPELLVLKSELFY